MKTALFERHQQLGARIAPFGGWDMPIQYAGIIAEHEHTRRDASVFDICHMGEFELRGASAETDLERLLTMSVASIAVGQCKYGFLLNDQGGVIDDLTCYRLDDQHFMLVVNAATCTGDAAWIRERLSPGTEFHDISAWTGKLDVQGPRSRQLLEDALETTLPDLGYFRFARINLLGVSCLLSRTGYTGEWGYELYVPVETVTFFWDAIVRRGDIKPAGLGARDTLRLEVGYPLYGHELTADRTPAAAFGKNFMALDKEFTGRASVMADLENGSTQQLVGLALDGRRAARAEDRVLDAEGNPAGFITSGSLAPSLGHAIAMAYVDRKAMESSGGLQVEVKGSKLPCRVAPLPFYQQGTARKKST
ncbi:MAG: glycine cleavage system aminomethyltransferase GcvT [Kiritimatiellia bacterium]